MIRLIITLFFVFFTMLFICISCKKEEEIQIPPSKVESSDNSIGSFDIDNYEIGGEQERLKLALLKPYSEWKREMRVRILYHKKGEDESIYLVPGSDDVASECFKSFDVCLYKSKKYSINKAYICFQVEKALYGKPISLDDLKVDLQQLYNYEVLLGSNPINSGFYRWHFDPYYETERDDLTAQNHLFLRERDFIGVSSFNISVFDFYPENKSKIDNYAKYLDDKYTDKIIKGIDFDNPNIPADPDRYKVKYWPNQWNLLFGKFVEE